MSRLESLRGQTLYAICFARNFVEFHFLPPVEESPVIIELSDAPGPRASGARPELDADAYYFAQVDDAVLRAFTAPRLSGNGHNLDYPAPGARDALCALIGDSVQDVFHREAAYIQLTLAGAHALRSLFAERGGKTTSPHSSRYMA
jgi:hypothetical protein